MLLAANIFQPLIDVLAAVLKFFHNDVGVSWGLSILLLTVCLRMALIPLALKQFHSMQRMQQHMPQMKAIQAKYKENKERQQQEMMKFYSENNVNPFASCVPLLIQWPFLIAMFWTLRGNLRNDICPKVQTAFRHYYAQHFHVSAAKAMGQTAACNTAAPGVPARDLTHSASFLFIHDLTNNPKGVEIAILLVLYIGTSLGSSLIMMQPGADPNQRRLMMILPVLFAFITIRFPAGALLYYIFFNFWMVGQQGLFKRLLGHRYTAVPVDAVAVGGAGGATLALGASGDGKPPKQTWFARLAGNALPQPEGAAQQTPGERAARAAAKRGGDADGASKGKADARPTAAAGNRAGPPPQSPRKKKKRSGRRR